MESRFGGLFEDWYISGLVSRPGGWRARCERRAPCARNEIEVAAGFGADIDILAGVVAPEAVGVEPKKNDG
jgi:hypothetical protein